jgi:hypothetical protein
MEKTQRRGADECVKTKAKFRGCGIAWETRLTEQLAIAT